VCVIAWLSSFIDSEHSVHSASIKKQNFGSCLQQKGHELLLKGQQ